MTDMASVQVRAARLLERWAEAVEEFWHGRADAPDLGCYGPGYMHWGVQSNWNYIAAMATLAAQPTIRDPQRWRQRALTALRYAMATHVTGPLAGNDGKQWGNSWISMLGIERAMHGVAHLVPELTDIDREALHRMLVSEADWLLLSPSRGRTAGVVAGLWNHTGRNNPENNIWSGCFLWRVADMYPDQKHADPWREQAHRFLINGVSVPADADDATLVAELPVSQWHVGANFFPNYALDHHGYLNVGYMAICVSNAALLHFDLKRAGAQAPASLYHHQGDLWAVLRRMMFGDARLARIGGDSRVRYAYCQEYLLPSLLFAADHLGDGHALGLVDRQVGLIEWEAEGGDGLFYASRLDAMRPNHHYYTRLESDRACVLAMLLNYLPLVEPPSQPAEPFEASVAGLWVEPEHGAAMHRSPTRLASFAWRAYGLTEALCLPPNDGGLAEWSWNLCPVVRFLGDDGSRPGAHRRLLAHDTRTFEGGFVTCGSVMEGVDVSVSEGASCTDQAITHIAFAALPDSRTCLCLQYVVAAADRVAYLSQIKDLHLVVPNDLFNGYRRTLHTVAGQAVLESPPPRDEVLEFAGPWANIDDRVGVVVLHGGDRLFVERAAQRRGGRYRSLYTESLCLQVRDRVDRCRPGEVLVDVGFAIVSGATAQATAGIRGGAIPFEAEGVRGVFVEGADGQRYALVANFGSQARTVDVFGETIELAVGTATVQGPPASAPAPRGAVQG